MNAKLVKHSSGISDSDHCLAHRTASSELDTTKLRSEQALRWVRGGPGRAPNLAQVVTSEERRTLSWTHKVAPETSAGQIRAEGNFRVDDHSSRICWARREPLR